MGACSRHMAAAVSSLMALWLCWASPAVGQEGRAPARNAPGSHREKTTDTGSPSSEESPVKAVSPPIQVAGTVVYGQTKIAFLAIPGAEGQEVEIRRVAEGETIAGYRVVEIQTKQVSFERDGEMLTLPVRHKQPRAPRPIPTVSDQPVPAPALPPPPAGQEREGVAPGVWVGPNVEISQSQAVIVPPSPFNGVLAGVLAVSNGVALLPGVGRFVIVEEGRIRFFNSNGSQIGLGIPTRGEANVAVFGARIVVIDEGRVRIFDPNGLQQGLTIRARR